MDSDIVGPVVEPDEILPPQDDGEMLCPGCAGDGTCGDDDCLCDCVRCGGSGFVEEDDWFVW